MNYKEVFDVITPGVSPQKRPSFAEPPTHAIFHHRKDAPQIVHFSKLPRSRVVLRNLSGKLNGQRAGTYQEHPHRDGIAIW